MFWFETSFQNIHEISKGSNSSFETSYDKSHNLSWRFINFGQQYEGNIYHKGHSVIFLLKHLGFGINLKNCILDPSGEIEFLGLIVNS